MLDCPAMETVDAQVEPNRPARSLHGAAGASVPDDLEIVHVRGRELPDEDVVLPEIRTVPWWLRAFYLVVGFALFVTALGLMKAGAQALVPALEGSVFTDNAASALGLGWLGACIVLSGSPIAASALTLLDGGALSRDESFTMLTGSRLGAAFVVLVAGTIYAIRRSSGASRRAPISIGILSLLTTAVVYLPGAVVGFLLLRSGAFDGLGIGTSPQITSLTDTLFGWLPDLLERWLPGWMLFPVGLCVLLLGFALFDRVVPDMQAQDRGAEASWYDRKWPMFLAGAVVCLLTLSVSVALTVLVPLVAKGYVRRANTIPYIMGANITTLADTLVAAILLGNQDAVRVVVAVTLTVTAWTLILLSLLYPLMRRTCLGIARRALASPKRLGLFVLVLFAVPVTLIAI